MVTQVDRAAVAGPTAIIGAILNLARQQERQVGDKLPSLRELSDALGLKLNLVRDALLQAQAEGLVRILPRAGVFLRSFQPTMTEPVPAAARGDVALSEQNIFHILDARRLLEIELGTRAAERRRLEDLLPLRQALEAMIHPPPDESHEKFVDNDIRFHVEIARLAGNAVLFMFQQQLMERLRLHFLDTPPWSAEQRCRTDRSHVAVYAALAAGDVGQTRAALNEHLNLTYDSLLHYVQELPVVVEPGSVALPRLAETGAADPVPMPVV